MHQILLILFPGSPNPLPLLAMCLANPHTAPSSTYTRKNGRPVLLPPLFQPPQIRINAHPMGLQHVPLWPALVYLRVQILQAEDLSALYE